MDRLTRPFVACGLGLLLATTGCKSTRNEVPPGRPFAKDGQQRKAIEFSSNGHPISAAATANFMPNNLGGSNLASGIGSSGSRPDGAAFGGPPGAYGAPGTSGMAQPGTGDPSTSRASGGSLEMPPPPGLPPAGNAARRLASRPRPQGLPSQGNPADAEPGRRPAVGHPGHDGIAEPAAQPDVIAIDCGSGWLG